MLESLKMTCHFPCVNELGMIKFDNLIDDAPGLDFLLLFFPPLVDELSYKSMKLYQSALCRDGSMPWHLAASIRISHPVFLPTYSAGYL